MGGKKDRGAAKRPHAPEGDGPKMEKQFKQQLNNTSLPHLSNFLSFGKRGTGGRNNTGRITVRHRGGGQKRRIYIVDYKGEIGKYGD